MAARRRYRRVARPSQALLPLDRPQGGTLRRRSAGARPLRSGTGARAAPCVGSVTSTDRSKRPPAPTTDTTTLRWRLVSVARRYTSVVEASVVADVARPATKRLTRRDGGPPSKKSACAANSFGAAPPHRRIPAVSVASPGHVRVTDFFGPMTFSGPAGLS
jgi:hypothetical protein